MTTLTTSRMILSGLGHRPGPVQRRGGLRALLVRLAAIAQADTARRPISDLPAHLRRDIGLGDIHVLDL